MDANVNVTFTPNGKIATPIVEIKNLNSFRFIERALAYEAQRQYKSLARDRPHHQRRSQANSAAGMMPRASRFRSVRRKILLIIATSPTPTSLQ